jgi:DNA-binding MarR family transcriptional regulator
MSNKDELILELSYEMRASQNLSDAFDEAVCDALKINRTDHRVVDVIQISEPIAPGELARRVGLSPAAITTSLDRLEKRGYVERSPDPDDRRKTLLNVTQKMHDEMHPFYLPMFEMFKRQASGLPEKRLREMLDFYRDGRPEYEAYIQSIIDKHG